MAIGIGWEENNPDPLETICIRCLLRNPSALFHAIDKYQQNHNRNENRDQMSDTSRMLTKWKTHSLTFEDNNQEKVELHLHREICVGKYLNIGGVCEKILEMLQHMGYDYNDNVSTAFSNPLNNRLQRLKLRNSTMTNQGFKKMMKHKIRSLEVVGCSHLTQKSLEEINNNCSETLLELKINSYTKNKDGDTVDINLILPDSLDPSEQEYGLKEPFLHYILNTPKLQKLSVQNFEVKGLQYFPTLFKPLINLTYLDISGCSNEDGMEGFYWLPKYLKNSLNSLILYDVEGIDLKAILNIIKLKKLKHLDISKHPDDADGIISEGYYSDPNMILKLIVENLPELKSLDVSATNLAGTGVFEIDSSLGSLRNQRNSRINPMEMHGETVNMPINQEVETENLAKCDIVGLISRTRNPLDFIGLYKCANYPNNRTHIPAKTISGDKDETQLLVAGQHYLDRPSYVNHILHDLCTILQNLEYKDFRKHLDFVLLAMNQYIDDEHLQFTGSACLFHIIHGDPTDDYGYIKRLKSINAKMKRKIIGTLLNTMFYYKNDRHFQRNGITMLNIFDGEHLIYEFERVVQILLHVIASINFNHIIVQEMPFHILDTIIWHVEGDQKLRIGDLGAVEKMLEVIRKKLYSKGCDNVLIQAWSTLWNVTDETPKNCERFLSGKGLELFLECRKEFPDAKKLLKSMVGMLGNVAEVKNLRPKMMKEAFVTELSLLLDSAIYDMDESCNATELLCHMVSDGPEAWTINEPTRKDILQRIARTIDGWKLTTKRQINYRSLEPILRLVQANDTPECQYWAVWALCNLIKADSDKYCSLLDKEGGISLLEKLICKDGNFNKTNLKTTCTLMYLQRDVRIQKVKDIVSYVAKCVLGCVEEWKQRKKIHPKLAPKNLKNSEDE